MGLRLRGPGGRVLAGGGVADNAQPGGFSFTATRTATHFVEARIVDDDNVSGYALRVSLDSPDSRATRSRTALGKVYNGELQYIRDTDWVRIRLNKGESYTSTLRFSSGVRAKLIVRDPGGTILGSDERGLEDDVREVTCRVTFRATKTGDYFLVAEQRYDEIAGYPYKLRTVRARPGAGATGS